MSSETQYESLIFIMIGIVIFGVLFVKAVTRFAYFKKDLKYVNNEIKRTRGLERKYWKQEKRRLLLAFFLFRS